MTDIDVPACSKKLSFDGRMLQANPGSLSGYTRNDCIKLFTNMRSKNRGGGALPHQAFDFVRVILLFRAVLGQGLQILG